MSRISGKINRTPVRSPSPDIANRSIITRTLSPLEQALSKSRQKSFKNIPIGMGFPSLEQLLEALKALEQKHKILERDYNIIKQQNYRLIRQTQMLHNQNNRLQRQKQYSSSMIIQSAKTDSSIEIRQYEERINQLNLQLKRMQEKLNIEQDKNRIILVENQNYKHVILNNVYANNNHPDNDNIKKKIQQSEQYFKEMMNSQMARHQLNLKGLLQQLQRKQNKIQFNQSVILAEIEKRNKTPQKLKRSLIYDGSTGNGQTSPRQVRYSRMKGNEELQKQNQMLSKKISVLSKEVDRILKQNQDMKMIINQNNRLADKPINESGTCKKCLEFKNQILELEQQLIKLKMMERSRYQMANFPFERDEGKYISQQMLKGYLKELQQIKNILTNQPVTSYINMIEQNFNKIQSIQQKISFVKSEKEKIIKALKDKLMIQDLQLLEIKRQNQIMKVQMVQLLEMNKSIKELIDSKSGKSLEYPLNIQNNSKNQDNWKVKRCLEEAINRINHLENQISMTLKN